MHPLLLARDVPGWVVWVMSITGLAGVIVVICAATCSGCAPGSMAVDREIVKADHKFSVKNSKFVRTIQLADDLEQNGHEFFEDFSTDNDTVFNSLSEGHCYELEVGGNAGLPHDYGPGGTPPSGHRWIIRVVREVPESEFRGLVKGAG